MGLVERAASRTASMVYRMMRWFVTWALVGLFEVTAALLVHLTAEREESI